MEASVVQAPAALGRLAAGGPLLRLRSDEQLVALFRSGSEDAFAVIHDRYRQRLFAYVRQMLSTSSRQDAEDVMQDVFMRAYSALRRDTRELNLKAWLYRVAHNRCIDHVRRPLPAVADVFEAARTPLTDPLEAAQRREDLRRLVGDVGRLPAQQRSALLMREIDGLPYADISEALGVTVAAVKSLLVRARVGLAEAAEARDTDCAIIRADLAGSYDRGVKASARARRHMRECAGCCEFKVSLRAVRRQFAALSPLGAVGPLALVKALGLGGAGASGGAVATAGGGGTVVLGTATACKVAAVVCTAAIATGGAVEVKKRVGDRGDRGGPAAAEPAAAAAVPAGAAAAHTAPPADVRETVILRRTEPAPVAGPDRQRAVTETPAPAAELPPAEAPEPPTVLDPALTTGGAEAPADAAPVIPVQAGERTEQPAGGEPVAVVGDEGGATASPTPSPQASAGSQGSGASTGGSPAGGS